MVKIISASVGQGGVNRLEDVQTVQELLNNVPVDFAGPNPKLVVDGKSGAMTIAAIKKFQQHHFGPASADGRVDPNGKTLTKLNEFFSVPGSSPPFSILEMTPIRLHAGALITAYVPSDTGDPKFQHLAKDYGGIGTTCGFLCHWLMWRLGCTNTNIVNRNEPGFKYIVGQNIARVWNAGKKPFINVTGTSLMQQGLRPAYGDIVYIKQSNGPLDTEHVFVFLEEFIKDGKIFWRTAEAGQKNSQNKQCARIKERELKLGKTKGAKLSGNSPEREIIGWISLAELTYNSMPPIPPVPPPPFDPLLSGG
jgi:hypothetical protein